MKELKQQRISNYFTFTGSLRKMPSTPPVRKGSKTKRCRNLFPDTASSSTANDDQESVLSSIISTVSKRKLPAPIFSDDENSENEAVPTKSPRKSSEQTSPETPKISINLNKPSVSNSKDLPQNQIPKVTSPAMKISPKKVTPDKNIMVLQDIQISPAKISPKKEETLNGIKTVNYEFLSIMRKFFINILNRRSWTSLINPREQQFLYDFFNIQRDYQFVCFKLFLWKQSWYNIFKYVEQIGLVMSEDEVSKMFNTLKINNFVKTDYMVNDSFALLNLLQLTDVRKIAKSFRLPNVSGPKVGLIAHLLKLCKTQVTLTSIVSTEDILRKRIQERLGYCVQLSDELRTALFKIYLLNIFTNPKFFDPRDYVRDMTYFNVVFPNYTVEDYTIFYTPQEFIRFSTAVQLRCSFTKAQEQRKEIEIIAICRSAFDKLIKLTAECGERFDDSRLPYLERFDPIAQYIYIISSGAKHVTRNYFQDVELWLQYLLAQNYCRSRRGGWFCQLSLIYTVYEKNYIKAANLLISALKEEKESFSELQLHELAQRAKQLYRKTYDLPKLLHDQLVEYSPVSCDRKWPQDVVDCKSMHNENKGGKRLYVSRNSKGDVIYSSVEDTALNYYRQMGYPNGKHCEGDLLIAIFLLLFWDIIYNDNVEGTFISKLQSAPLDMFTKYFYPNRERYIKRRLESIREKWLPQEFDKRLIASWNEHSHERSLCQLDTTVNDVQCLIDISACIGRPLLAKICERLAKDFCTYQSGFPDLIVWNLEEKKSKFVEVKSENDKLSIKQKLWLNYLMDNGASVAVCYVDSKSSKKKCFREGTTSI